MLCWAWWRICLAQYPATGSKWMPRETRRGKAIVCQYLPSMFSSFPAYHDQEVSMAVGSTFICHSPWWPFLVVAFSFSDPSSCFLNPCKLVAAVAFSSLREAFPCSFSPSLMTLGTVIKPPPIFSVLKLNRACPFQCPYSWYRSCSLWLGSYRQHFSACFPDLLYLFKTRKPECAYHWRSRHCIVWYRGHI